MTGRGFTLFETARGGCTIAWTARGVCGVCLPEVDADLTRYAMRRRFPHAEEAEPPVEIARARDGIVRSPRCTTRGSEPWRSRARATGSSPCWPGTRSPCWTSSWISTGSETSSGRCTAQRGRSRRGTRSYGEVAAAAAAPDAAQAVGRALGRNPFPVVVPCHRVLAANGRLHGFSAPGGLQTKLRMLAIERALDRGQPALFDGPEAFSLRPR